MVGDSDSKLHKDYMSCDCHHDYLNYVSSQSEYTEKSRAEYALLRRILINIREIWKLDLFQEITQKK